METLIEPLESPHCPNKSLDDPMFQDDNTIRIAYIFEAVLESIRHQAKAIQTINELVNAVNELRRNG